MSHDSDVWYNSGRLAYLASVEHWKRLNDFAWQLVLRRLVLASPKGFSCIAVSSVDQEFLKKQKAAFDECVGKKVKKATWMFPIVPQCDGRQRLLSPWQITQIAENQNYSFSLCSLDTEIRMISVHICISNFTFLFFMFAYRMLSVCRFLRTAIHKR